MIKEILIGVFYLAIVTMLVRPNSSGATMVKDLGNNMAGLIHLAVSG